MSCRKDLPPPEIDGNPASPKQPGLEEDYWFLLPPKTAPQSPSKALKLLLEKIRSHYGIDIQDPPQQDL